jgi:DNA-directed RNA polymerase subunit RPC12/RpoP
VNELRDIDRTTTHTCANLRLDRAHQKRHNLPMYTCVNCERPINVHYVQYAHICSECRRECLDHTDVVRNIRCTYCGERL